VNQLVDPVRVSVNGARKHAEVSTNGEVQLQLATVDLVPKRKRRVGRDWRGLQASIDVVSPRYEPGVLETHVRCGRWSRCRHRWVNTRVEVSKVRKRSCHALKHASDGVVSH
jgi:hypothetical protein